MEIAMSKNLILPDELNPKEVERAKELLRQAMAISGYTGNDFTYGRVTAVIHYIVSYKPEDDLPRTPPTLDFVQLPPDLEHAGSVPVFGAKRLVETSSAPVLGSPRTLLRKNELIVVNDDVIPAYPWLTGYLEFWRKHIEGKIIGVKIAGAPFMSFNDLTGSLVDRRYSH